MLDNETTPSDSKDYSKPVVYASRHMFSNAPVCMRDRKKKSRRKMARLSRRVNRRR